MKIIFIILLASNSLLAITQEFLTSTKQNVLLELYTSEGCSSCPNADRYLNNFKHNPKIFTRIFPLAFHVTYWNYIGWKDPFSNINYDQRQKNYRIIGHSKGVYTPQFFLNNSEWRNFFSDKKLNYLQKNVGKLKIVRKDDELDIHYSKNASIAHIAILGFNQKSKVDSGENNGKTFYHDFVVLSYKNVKFNHNLKTKLPKIGKIPNKKALIVWLTNDDYVFEQVAGGYLK